MHNASFDIRITKNNLGIDILDALYCDTMLLKHTAGDENPPFGLKEIAMIIGAESEGAANAEQLALKQHVIGKGGNWTLKDKQMYKADLSILVYGARIRH
jgi:hypothetical protein